MSHNLSKIFKVQFMRNNKLTIKIIELIPFLLTYSVFNILLINKFFPVTEGWFQDYARYMHQEFFPYRDFYIPVPPGFIYLTDFLYSVWNTYGIFDGKYLEKLTHAEKPWIDARGDCKEGESCYGYK